MMVNSGELEKLNNVHRTTQGAFAFTLVECNLGPGFPVQPSAEILDHHQVDSNRFQDCE